MPVHYITADGQPPMGGRVPGQRYIAPPAPSRTSNETPPPVYTCKPVCDPPASEPTPAPAPMFVVAHPPPSASVPASWHCFPLRKPVPAPEEKKCECKKEPAPPVTDAQPPPYPTPAGCTLKDDDDVAGNKIHPKATVLAPLMAVIHLIARGKHPWAVEGMEFEYSLHEVPTSETLKTLIELIRPEADEYREDGIVECLEIGDGKWRKGSSFKLSEERSKQTLGEIGWTGARGRDRKPVWIAYA